MDEHLPLPSTELGMLVRNCQLQTTTVLVRVCYVSSPNKALNTVKRIFGGLNLKTASFLSLSDMPVKWQR